MMQFKSLCCRAVFFLILLFPATMLSMDDKKIIRVKSWLTLDEFEEQKQALEELQETDIASSKINKFLDKLDSCDSGGNAKYLVQQIAVHFRDEPRDELKKTNSNDELKKIIGEKYSTIPNDPGGQIGAYLWLQKRKKDHMLSRCIKMYITNSQRFGTAAEKYFFGKNTSRK